MVSVAVEGRLTSRAVHTDLINRLHYGMPSAMLSTFEITLDARVVGRSSKPEHVNTKHLT